MLPYEKLFDFFPIKILGCLLEAMTQGTVSMLSAFMGLVFLDMLTRWMAISYGRLKGKGESPSLWETVAAIPAARREGLIRSDVMKRRGLEKLCLYYGCLALGALVDWLIQAAHGTSDLLPWVVSYLAMTEALSIVENLSEAGVPSMGRLLEKMKGLVK